MISKWNWYGKKWGGWGGGGKEGIDFTVYKLHNTKVSKKMKKKKKKTAYLGRLKFVSKLVKYPKWSCSHGSNNKIKITRSLIE